MSADRPGMPCLDVTPRQWEVVRGILRAHVSRWPVWAFGSRATWKAKPYSDLDLAVITQEPMGLGERAALIEAFSESDLPWKVDVVDWATTSPAFRRIIERDRVLLQDGA